MAKKLKTHKGMLKRAKITKGKKKKILCDKSCNNHLLTNKGKNHKKSPYGKLVTLTHKNKMKRLMPYHTKGM